jgi:bifunctional non-homologous end joining protein LigD
MSVIAFKRPRRAAPFPAGCVPTCLAENLGRAPTGARWVHEIKYDGFRSQAHIRDGTVRIFSSGEHDWTDRYRSIAEELAALRTTRAVLDGEIVVLRQDGTCDFWALQEEVRAGRSDRLHYFVFDILCHDGADVRARPLRERKAVLRALLASRRPRRGCSLSIISKAMVPRSGPRPMRWGSRASSRRRSNRPTAPAPSNG